MFGSIQNFSMRKKWKLQAQGQRI